MNVNKQPENILNNVDGVVPYSKIKGNVGPYVKSRVWAARVKRAAETNTNSREAGINLSNKRPTLKMVKLALAQALGVRYTTTGRGGGLEDAPFIPGVSAIPTIQRNLWSTEESHLPVDEIRRRMDGHWGIDGISDNIARNPLNIRNARPRRETLINGAISSFYHPAFTQLCHGNGEWLINGFKVQKQAVIEKASRILGRQNASSITNGNSFLVGAGTKGTIAAEADITKITILNWPRGNSQNYSRTRIIFTIGEDKVGPGESAQSHGKEVAQLRFIMFAIYYMWYELHIQGMDAHPWGKIPVQNITLEAVFLAAGAERVQNTKITEQAEGERTGILAPGENYSQKKIIKIVPVNLDKFCAIFRLDAYRFAAAMVAVDKKFRNKMIEYFQNIEKMNKDPRGNNPVNNTTLINASSGLSTVRLNNATLRQPFKPVVLRAPRGVWANNQNRKNWEIKWFNKYKNWATRTTLRNRPSINQAYRAFGRPTNFTNNKASYYSGESNENWETRVKQSASRGQNVTSIQREQAEEEARRAAVNAARKAALEAGAPPVVRTAFQNVIRASTELAKPRLGPKARVEASQKLKAAQNVVNIFTNQTKRNSIINRVISGNFENEYATFLREHSPYAPYIKNVFNNAIQTKIVSNPNQANVLQYMKNVKSRINAGPSKKRKINTLVKYK